MFKVKLFITILIGWCSILGMTSGRILVCNYNPSTITESEDRQFKPNNIDPSLCTHLIYPLRFNTTSSGGYNIVKRKYDYDNDKENGAIAGVIDLKKLNPNLKLIAGVSKNGMKLNEYKEMAVNASKRELFITTALEFIQNNTFNGLELNWKFNNKKGDSLPDRLNFVKILAELNEAFKERKLELSITVGSGDSMDHIAYHVPSVVNYVNYVNVLADAGRSKSVLFRNPLRGEHKKSLISVIKHWISQEIPTSKLVLGLSFYGTYAKLSDANKYRMNSPIKEQKDFYPYSYICRREKNWDTKWDTQYDVSILQKKAKVFVYDNIKSIELKVDFGNCFQLGGYYVSTVDYDDFRGKCGEKYGLLRTVHSKLNEIPHNNFCLNNGFNLTNIDCE